jgi:hypothetical protein
MGQRYKAYNAPAPTTAGIVKVTTGTAIKTMLQIATPSTEPIFVVEWGISFDGSAAGTPILVELIDTDVAATVTAHVAAGLPNLTDPNGRPSNMTLGTSATGYTGSAEGSITASRVLDAELVAPTNQYRLQWPLGLWPQVKVSRFLRVRVTAAAAVNALCDVTWEE